MKEMRFQVEVHATKEKVWDTLWQDETFRQWASIIDPGTYRVGDLIEGSEVQFISSENGYGVTSKVVKLKKYEYIVLKHTADTQKSGREERDKEWTGGRESYELVERDGLTILTLVCDIPIEMAEYFRLQYPKALLVVKELAEKH